MNSIAVAKNATNADKNSNISSQHVRAETSGDEPRPLMGENFSSCPLCLNSLLKVKQILFQKKLKYLQKDIFCLY